MIHIIDDYYVTGGARDYTLIKDTHMTMELKCFLK